MTASASTASHVLYLSTLMLVYPVLSTGRPRCLPYPFAVKVQWNLKRTTPPIPKQDGEFNMDKPPRPPPPTPAYVVLGAAHLP